MTLVITRNAGRSCYRREVTRINSVKQHIALPRCLGVFPIEATSLQQVQLRHLLMETLTSCWHVARPQLCLAFPSS